MTLCAWCVLILQIFNYTLTVIAQRGKTCCSSVTTACKCTCVV